jgi:hypothetical protein
MERQKVTIDADRLTRVALLKRAVLKRCVYGVDLNGDYSKYTGLWYGPREVCIV